MGLDAYLSVTTNKLEFQFAIQTQIHKGIVENRHVRDGQVKLILRMQNYYDDCSFEHHELTQLIEELRLLESSYPKGHMTGELLETFRKTCEEGLKRNLNLYFLCD